MKAIFFAVFFLIQIAVAAETFKPYKAYIDNVEDDDVPVSVFKKPGQNWKTLWRCTAKKKKEDCDQSIGWPGRDAQIIVLEKPVIAETIDPLTGKLVDEEYVKVEFSYSRKGADGVVHYQKGIGYVESSYISKSKTKGFYKASNTEKDKDCPPDKKDAQSKIKSATKDFKDIAISTANLSLEKKAELLNKTVGFCPLKPPTKTPTNLDPKQNVYDQKILPTLMKAEVPRITDENSKPMTRSQMIEIDTLARTLYGEMGRCYRKGLQYPMAVAKIILNRTENEKRSSEFTDPPHSVNAPTLTKICTTPSQFSMWLKNIKGVANQTLHQGLCPPIQKDAPFWKANAADALEADIWKNTMRIATEAILYPTQFKARTKQIDGYHYTSGVGAFYNMKKEIPSIEGKKIDRAACIEIWKE